MENEVATLHVTLGLALRKLLLVGLHFPSREIDRLFDRLNNILVYAGDDETFPHAGGDTGQYSHSTTGVLLCDRDESRLLATCFLSVGLQTSIQNEPKSSCKSREDFGIRLSLGAGMQVVQIQLAGFWLAGGSISVWRYPARLHFSEEQQQSRLCHSCRNAEGHSLLWLGEPSVCRHFFQGWHWCFAPCWCGWQQQHVEGVEKGSQNEWCSCQGRFAWGLASEWIKGCRPAAEHCEYQTGKWRNLSSRHCDRGKGQNAAWWSRPTACLAAHRLKPKAGEANQKTADVRNKKSARSRLRIPCELLANMQQAPKSKVSNPVVFFAPGLNSASSLSASDFPYEEQTHDAIIHCFERIGV